VPGPFGESGDPRLRPESFHSATRPGRRGDRRRSFGRGVAAWMTSRHLKLLFSRAKLTGEEGQAG